MHDALVDVLSGACGGLMLVAVGHPFDTLKVTQQTSKMSLAQALAHVRGGRGGWLGLYSGAASPAVGAPAMNSAIFFSWGLSERLMRRLVGASAGEPLLWYQYFAAGGLTGLLASPVECAVDLVKVKMQVGGAGAGAPTNSFAMARHLVASYGVGGVFQGLFATALRNVPANACYFGAYKTMLNAMSPDDGQPPAAAGILAAGAVAGVAYWTLSYPLDFLKSRVQADHSDSSKREFRSYADTVRSSLADGGVRALFRGFTVTLLRAVPANAACFYGYELCRSMLTAAPS